MSRFRLLLFHSRVNRKLNCKEKKKKREPPIHEGTRASLEMCCNVCNVVMLWQNLLAVGLVFLLDLVDEVFDVNLHAEDAASIDEDLGEEHQHRAVYLTFRRQKETGCCHCRSEDEQQASGDFLGHASPKADRMAVMLVRITLIITAQVFLVCCVIALVMVNGSLTL